MKPSTWIALALVSIGVVFLVPKKSTTTTTSTTGGTTGGSTGGSNLPGVVDPNAGAGGSLSDGNSAGEGVVDYRNPTWTPVIQGDIMVQYRIAPNPNTFTNGFAPSPGQVF